MKRNSRSRIFKRSVLEIARKLTSSGFGMRRAYFLERLRRSARLIEFALRLGAAKNLLREIKADPMVSPFLDGRKIRRMKHQGHAAAGGDYSEGMAGHPKTAVGVFIQPFHGFKAARKQWESERGISRAFPGITISKGAKGQKIHGVLEALAHEYGHAKSGQAHQSIPKLPQPSFAWPKETAIAKANWKIRAEQEANRNAGQALARAGASPVELRDFFKLVQGGQASSDLVHPSYIAFLNKIKES